MTIVNWAGGFSSSFRGILNIQSLNELTELDSYPGSARVLTSFNRYSTAVAPRLFSGTTKSAIAPPNQTSTGGRRQC